MCTNRLDVMGRETKDQDPQRGIVAQTDRQRGCWGCRGVGWVHMDSFVRGKDCSPHDALYLAKVS